MLTVGPPLLLLRSTQECWRCNARQEVIALGSPIIAGDEPEGAENIEELVFLCEITSMPADVEAWVSLNAPQFEKTYSKAAELSYFANICECGANFGDHYLFSEPGGAFFPETEVEAGKITYEALPFKAQLKFDCGLNQGLGAFIMSNAKEIPAPKDAPHLFQK